LFALGHAIVTHDGSDAQAVSAENASPPPRLRLSVLDRIAPSDDGIFVLEE